MTLPNCLPSNQDFYIGGPPNMVKLIPPDAYYSDELDSGLVVHQLITGGNATQRPSGKLRHHYGLTYTARLAEAADQIVGLHYGMLGPGPYRFIDPLWRNILPPHISGSGRRLQNSAGLWPTVGAAAYAGAIAPPAFSTQLPPGVQSWTGAGNGSALYLNASAAGVLETDAPPCQLNLLPLTAAIYLSSASGAPSVSVQLYYNDANGALISAVTLVTVALSTVWQRVVGGVAASAIPANAVTCGLKLLCNTAASPAIYLSAPAAQYVTAAAASLPAWVLGLGVPSVMLGGPTPSTHAQLNRRRTHTLDLIET